MKKLFLAGILLLSFNMVHAADGIDCVKPTLTSISSNTSTPFSFTCTNNTTATFSHFDLKINELDELTPATVNFTVTWPHGENDIRPGDVGTVTGTFSFPEFGLYEFDFDKTYGDKTYSGIFCDNGKKDTCFNVNAAPRFVYVPNFDPSYNGQYFQCKVNATTGQFEDCAANGGSVPTIVAITFQIVSGQLYAYITDGYFGAGKVYYCKVDPITGAFQTNCPVAGQIGGTDPNTAVVKFRKNHHKLYAYISNGVQDGQYWICEVNANGTFSNCGPSGPEFSNGVVYFAFKEFNHKTYLYVPNGNYDGPDEAVFKCNIDNSVQLPNTCPDSGAGATFAGPNAITFFSTLRDTYAYVSSLDTYVSKCAVNRRNGKLGFCTPVLTNVEGPGEVVITNINHTNYAYIAVVDYCNGNAYGEGYVEQCEVDFSGDFVNCKDSGAGTIFVQPLGLTFLP